MRLSVSSVFGIGLAGPLAAAALAAAQFDPEPLWRGFGTGAMDSGMDFGALTGADLHAGLLTGLGAASDGRPETVRTSVLLPATAPLISLSLPPDPAPPFLAPARGGTRPTFAASAPGPASRSTVTGPERHPLPGQALRRMGAEAGAPTGLTAPPVAEKRAPPARPPEPGIAFLPAIPPQANRKPGLRGDPPELPVVPLPPGALLLLGGLATLAALRRRG